MLQKNNRYRILRLFFREPHKHFHIREISRELGLAVTSVSNHLESLAGEGFIVREKRDIYPAYMSGIDSEKFRFYKMLDTLVLLEESGLLENIHSRLMPDCIILFGSASRGEDTGGSDVDLFVQAGEREMDLSRYERALKRKISILFDPDFCGLSPELKNNIINGKLLRGYLKVF